MEVMTGLPTVGIHPPTPTKDGDLQKPNRAFPTNSYLSHIAGPVDRHPQTPPKDTELLTAKQAPPTNSYLSQIAAQVLYHTHTDSPSSSDEARSRSSERRRKRVDFLQGEPKFLTASSRNIIAAENALLSSPPSRDTKPLKSILKPYKDSPLSASMGNEASQPPRTFPRMLEDVVRELASPSLSSRLDAYKTLNGCLQAYDNLPDLRALEEKMSLLTDFIHRDLTKTAPSNESIYDTQLIQQVLKLLTTFVWTPKIAAMLQDEFCIAVLDQSINVLADHTTSKQIVLQYIHLLGIQKFRSKVMTEDRANRLIDVLVEITKHIKGTTIAGSRLRVYRALITQANAMMIRRVDDWIADLYHGMLSSIKEVRVAALAFGLDAGFSIGTASQVSRGLVNLFNRKSSQGKKFSDVIDGRLKEMLSERHVKNDGAHVPQVWSITLLFLRSRAKQFEQWEDRKRWIEVITDCFNSPENLVKSQAYVAWNRFIFAINPDSSTDPSMRKMLRQPVKTELARKPEDKRPRQPKKAIQASYCTLLYYAFRPLLSHDSISCAWRDYVVNLLDKTDTAFGCEVLIALLGDTHSKVWNEKRVIGIDPVKPEELPRLDPKWVRSNAGQVLNVLQAFLRSAESSLPELTEAPVLPVWRVFTKALSDAASKEVKVSGETMSAVAQMMTCLKRFWTDRERQNSTRTAITTDLQTLATLVDIAVNNMGPLPFTEKRLVSGIKVPFEVVDSPSNGPSQRQGFLASAMIHLICMLLDSSGSINDNADFAGILKNFIEIALRSATSRRSKLALLRELCHLASSRSLNLQAKVSPLISEFLLQIMSSTKPDEGTMDSPYQPGLEYKDMLQILELEAQSCELTEQSSTVFEQACKQILQESGTAGMIISIAEPFATFLFQELNKKVTDNVSLTDVVQRATLLIKNTSWPESRGDMGRAYKALWGAGSSMPKTAPAAFFTPFDNVYSLIDHILLTVYANQTRVRPIDVAALLQAVTSFIEACPRSQSSGLLKHLQRGVGTWIVDSDRVMSSSGLLYTSVMELWKTVTNKIQNLPQFDTALLSTLSTLINAGLSCKQKALLTLSVNTWNSTFGLVTDITYPDNLQDILLRLRSISFLRAPGFAMDDVPEVHYSPLELMEMPDEYSLTLQPVLNHLSGCEPQQANPDGDIFHLNNHNPIASPHNVNAREEQVPQPTTPTFHYDDSPIMFTAINSSPRTPRQNRNSFGAGLSKDDVAMQLNSTSLPIAKGTITTSSTRALSKTNYGLAQSYDGSPLSPRVSQKNLGTGSEQPDLDHLLDSATKYMQFAIDESLASNGTKDTVDPSTLLHDHEMQGMDEPDSERELARLLRRDLGYEGSSTNIDNATVTPRDTLMSEDIYEDEVAAQIAYDMNRAVSQAGSSSKATSPLKSSKKDTGKKRKRSSQIERDYERDYSEEPKHRSSLKSPPQDSVGKRKRTRVSDTINSNAASSKAVSSKASKKRTSKVPSSSQGSVERNDPQQSEEEILDCIVLDPPPFKQSASCSAKDVDWPTLKNTEFPAFDKTKSSHVSKGKGKGKAKEVAAPIEHIPSDSPPSSPHAVDNSEPGTASPDFDAPSSSAPARMSNNEPRMERPSPYLFKRREKSTAKDTKKPPVSLKARGLFAKRSITPTQTKQLSSGRRSKPSRRIQEIILDDDSDIQPGESIATVKSANSTQRHPISIDPDSSESELRPDEAVQRPPVGSTTDVHPSLDSTPLATLERREGFQSLDQGWETPPGPSPMRTRSKRKGIVRRVYRSDESAVSEVTPQPIISDTPPSASAKLRSRLRKPVDYRIPTPEDFSPEETPDLVASPSKSAEAQEVHFESEESPMPAKQDSQSHTPDVVAQAAPEGSGTQARVSLTAGGMLSALRNLLEGARSLVLGPGEARPITRVLHQLGLEVDAAEERGA